jgi:ectoine hydroxylase-related dioxygenase (phytanoyl-CoA dioxygenase family)
VGELHRLHASASPASIVRALNDSGVVIVEDLLDDDLLARLNAELDPLVAQAGRRKQRYVNEGLEWFFGDRTLSVTGVAGKSLVFAAEVVPHPLFMALCDAVLLPNCSDYQLNIGHVLDRGPGAAQQFLHRDELVWIHVPRPHPQLQLASMLALGEFTSVNGATRVVPGSHLWEPDRKPMEHEIVAAEMDRGSALVYLGSTIHGGGPNVTQDQRRRGMHVSYCVGWLRTEENQCLTTPLDRVRALPRRSQQLLGYGAHDAMAAGGGYLGTVEIQDPVELIARGEL